MDETRFNRLEVKIDKLTEAVTSIARVEEKILASNHRIENLEVRVSKTEDDLDKIADLARANGGAARFAEKLFWIVAGGVVGFLIKLAG